MRFLLLSGVLHCARLPYRYAKGGFDMNVPNDPAILLSFVNTKLRDEFPSLDELSKALCISADDIESKLAGIGYFYNKERNCFA